MMMRATQLFAFVLIALRVQAAETPTEIYSNPHHGFSVSVPADWERIDDKGNECKAMFRLPQDGTVSFAGVKLEKGVDLAQFEEQSMRQPKPEMLINLLGVRNFKLLSSKSAELAKVKARLIEYTALYDGLEYKGCLYLAISNGRGFLLRFQAPTDLYPSQKDAFLKTAQSFKVNTPDGRDLSEFSNKKLGYSLKYPATWYSFTMIQGTHAFCAPQTVGGGCPGKYRYYYNAARGHEYRRESCTICPSVVRGIISEAGYV